MNFKTAWTDFWLLDPCFVLCAQTEVKIFTL